MPHHDEDSDGDSGRCESVPKEIVTKRSDSFGEDDMLDTGSIPSASAHSGHLPTKRHKLFHSFWLKSVALFLLLASACTLQFYSFLPHHLRIYSNPMFLNQTARQTKEKAQPSYRYDPLRDPKQQQKSAFSFFHKKTKKVEVFDVNGPPVRLPEGETLKTLAQKTRRGGAGGDIVRQGPDPPRTPAAAKKEHLSFPAHASEILNCGSSVTNFVVNATDRKDECDGLIKAFDKTCNNNNNEGDDQPRGNERRHLWQKLSTPYSVRLLALAYRTKQILKNLPRVFWSGRPSYFLADTEVMRSWGDARYMVENGIDRVINRQARMDLHQQCSAREHDKRHLEEVQTNTSKPNLHLPFKTSQKVSESGANDVLLLQQGEKMIKAANESIAEEAAKSKKSISETAEAVNAVLNDPSSIAARTCCASILNVYQELCSKDEEEEMSDSRLFFLVFVMALCGMVKSLIRHFKLLWLPEAAGCILVGVLSGYAMDWFPHQDISFDGQWFLRIMVPPIVFEAAISIDKRSFRRHLVPIFIYAVGGTLMATFLTAEVVHRGTHLFSRWCSPIPYVEALTFGALISSIDPIAVLSVLSNMGMNDTDTIYVLIFGESLLNDGVAIVLFHTLVHFLDENLVIDRDALLAASVHFGVVAFGSLLVGIGSGILSTVYYWLFHGCQTPLVEVLMFLCWALLPYYVCDGIGWSGIVASVAVGFVMDMHIVGQRRHGPLAEDAASMDASEHTATSCDSNGIMHKEKPQERMRRRIFGGAGHLSAEAKTHIGFVTEIISAAMETAIFAYLGFFLFSHRYHWNFFHMIIAIFACCLSRAIMIPSLGFIANWITRIQQRRDPCRQQTNLSRPAPPTPAGVVVDRKMQVVLWFAGLRGAMSFALVEDIPLYDSFSGEGTRLKPELKAMTSASIMFTVFVLGGYTFFVMRNLGLAGRNGAGASPTELAALMSKSHGQFEDDDDEEIELTSKTDSKASSGVAFRRARHTQTILSV